MNGTEAAKLFSPPAQTQSQETALASSYTVPGMLSLSASSIAEMMPKFDHQAFTVADPLNPPETIPQATEAQFAKSETIYQGGIRALKLWGMSYDMAREKFNVIGKMGKAFGAGFNAVTSLEQAKGAYLDFLNQQQTTEQKAIALDLNTYRTGNDKLVAVQVKIDLQEQLKQAEYKAQISQQKTLELSGKLSEFKKALGQFLPA